MLSTFVIVLYICYPSEARNLGFSSAQVRTQIPRFARNDNKHLLGSQAMPELQSRNPRSNPVHGQAEVASSWKFALRALRSRNYRLFFTGQSVSLVGTWMTQIATSWLVYRLTGSAWLLGIVGFASRIPTFFLAPFAGVWIDRWNRHHTLVVTQILSMLQSFALAWLALARIITIQEVIWLGSGAGCHQCDRYAGSAGICDRNGRGAC